MKITVKDSSVIIDLLNGGLLEFWFELKIETWITDAMLAELSKGKQYAEFEKFIESGAILVDEIPDAQALDWLSSVSRFAKEHRLSFADSASIFCAQSKEARLLTGDRRMGKMAKKLGVEVKGLLWVLDELFEKKIIDGETACVSLSAILSCGARLPQDECEKRFTSWSESGGLVRYLK